jgi:acetolactate synthase-1/2/3 large subunit
MVIVIAGDGSFKMNSSEIETIVNYNLPLVVLILNNSTLGMVRQWQDLFYEKRYSYVDFHRGPDFVKLAESYGALGMRIKKPEEVEETIHKALESNKPVIIDCIIDAEEKVFPMVPAGSPIDSMIGV